MTVLEKNDTAGGRCNQIVQDGHRFDIGPTLFLMPEVWEETFAALGEKMSDHLELKRIDPTYKVHFEDGLKLELTSDIGKMQTQLEKVEKTAFSGFLNYITEGNKHYKMSLEKFVGRNFYNIFEYLSLTNLPLIFQLKALAKHHANTGRFFKDERLKAAFTFQNMYLGLSPYDAPATYSLLQYTELAEGVWYPMGGMYAAIQALTKIAEKLGVKFIYNAPVKKILTNKNEVLGVVLENGNPLVAHIFIGKETHRIKDEISEASEGILDYEDAAEYGRAGLAELLKRRPMKEWVRLTGIPRQTLYDIRNGAKPGHETWVKICNALRKMNA